jgi:AcrR family transcriptional regulator
MAAPPEMPVPVDEETHVVSDPSAAPASSTPRTARGVRTAAKLRGSARAIFAELGFAAARVEDIVADAGVSHGTFYTYYENKAAVLDALLDETASALLAVVEEPWDGADVGETVETVIGRFVAIILRDADVIGTWLEASAHDPHFRERLREVREGAARQVAVHIAPIARSGHDPEVVAGALVAMVEGYATRGLLTAPQADRDAAVRTMARLWVGGLQRVAEDA